MKETNKRFFKRGIATLVVMAALMMSLAACNGGETTPTTQANTTAVTTQAPQAATVSLDINCKNLLSEMDKVPANKKEYVPQDGVILNKENIEIQEGDTVFSFIKKYCEENKVQIDYDAATSYVTSLSNLNEKDCGAESGWMFKVNNESPTVGAGEFVLKAGDKIEFYYITSYSQM